jgi:hypothetical protein
MISPGVGNGVWPMGDNRDEIGLDRARQCLGGTLTGRVFQGKLNHIAGKTFLQN